MSRIEVRQILRAELNAYCVSQGVPFYDTINDNPEIDDAFWVTCDFSAYSNENLCYANGAKIEVGVCDVDIFTRAGIGDFDAVTLAGKIQKYFNGFRSGDLVVVNVLPPNEATSASALSYYGVSVSMEYSFLYS